MLMLVMVLGMLAIGVNRLYLSTRCECDQRNCARGYGCNLFSHFVWL